MGMLYMQSQRQDISNQFLYLLLLPISEYQREAEFQTHTHFKLGSDEPPTSSVYRKDFDTFHRQSSMMAEIEPRPRNSKVCWKALSF